MWFNIFLQQGFDMNVGDDGRTGFYDACAEGYLNVIQFFLQQRFDMNIGDNNGYIGFHVACGEGQLDVIEFLLQQRFDMNIGDNNGCTGFHDACLFGNFNVVQFFLQQGFEGINERDLLEVTGLEILIGEPQYIRDNVLFMPCVLLLIEAGAELDENDVFEELIPAIQNRIIEITFMKEIIFEK